MYRSLLVLLVVCFAVACGAPATPGSTPLTGRSTETNASLAIAIVFCGSETFVGNDDFETDENARYEGFLHDLTAAIEHRRRKATADTRATTIVYDSGARVVRPMTSLGSLRAPVVGKQLDYYSKFGMDLVKGVTLGLDSLARDSAARRVLIVVGDGSDTVEGASRDPLSQLGDRARRDRIEVHALVVKGALSSDSHTIDSLTSEIHSLSSSKELTRAFDKVLER